MLHLKTSAASRNREFWSPLLAALRCAAQAKLCSFPHIKKPHVESGMRPVRFLYPDKFEAFVSRYNDHLIAPLRFALATGASNSEIWRVTWGDVDLERGEVSFRSRVVAIAPDVVAMLACIARKRPGVLPDEDLNMFGRHDGEKYADRFGSGGQCKTALATRRRKTGINVRLRDLQDTYAVWHLAEHRSFAKLKKESGWRSAKVNRYRTVSREELDRVCDQLLLRRASSHTMTPALRSVPAERSSAFRGRDLEHPAPETQAPFRGLAVRCRPRPRPLTSGT
jgi:integrase